MSILSAFASTEKSVLEALSKSQAIIEFDLKGNILFANENFCAAVGYEPGEIIGQHHRMFVEPAEAGSEGYKDFWKKLARGEYDQRQYKRIGKGGREIWIEASYNPVFKAGKPCKVVKIATDITAAKLKAAEDSGKLDALSRAQAVIEFTPTGEILTANENFLATLDYKLSEIQGKHHSMFCEAAYSKSKDYRDFWKALASGEFIAEEFLRFGKNGKKVYIQASYNPILDMDGRVFKVVKFATDITDRVNSVDALAKGIRALSDGDLMQNISEPFLPALDKLRIDFNSAAENLRHTMQSIAQNAGTIARGSEEIRIASEDLAQRTEEQASSVEETASSLDEMTATIRGSSEQAQQAGEMVKKTKESAERSGVIVRQAVSAMDKIKVSSSEIKSTISMIDEIAFQTNLLALNAGVEAARAGEAGKGFAVVAQEVRELAQRSAKAAKEIKHLIDASSDHVKNGVSLVGETGSALDEIVMQVQQVTENVISIVEASKEQSSGLNEINNAVNVIDSSTQKNAAMVEQSKTTASGLANDAEAMFQLIQKFNIGHKPAPQTTHRTPIDIEPMKPIPSAPEKKAQPVLAFNGNAAIAEDSWEEF
ncbi:methyl-accepting chemotaxis protein [Ahrensia marina]|uniref:Chemotaxis protein n=1 Tax=Ahrensia marina TaxID=1514904 RepID=A0A0M9GLU2_9HYPH|nr:PAS domain-containing methyl-accepting chemotaxis protein [Ahrensia marina]KPB00783.1 chemotaxis protein [Ahrensia marina]